MPRIVADLGNSRLKLGRLDDGGTVLATMSLGLEDAERWRQAAEVLGGCPLRETRWWIASVNPPVASRLEAFLQAEGILQASWYRSAAEVPIPKDVEGAEDGGADRALLALAAVSLTPQGRPILVVSCGTAITIEAVDEQGVWRGGSIGPGLGLAARALNLMTAQLPEITLKEIPEPRGKGTIAALEAGIFWSVAGGIRELINRQSRLLPSTPDILWTGGDAPLLAPAVSGDHARLEPNLVLRGLAILSREPAQA